MNKKFILALVLASGMSFAQTGSSGSTPDQQPSQQPSSPSTSSPASSDQSSQSATPTSTSDQTSMRGCLKQSGGNWVLSADNGQSVNLQGDSSVLKPHDGHQVQHSGNARERWLSASRNQQHHFGFLNRFRLFQHGASRRECRSCNHGSAAAGAAGSSSDANVRMLQPLLPAARQAHLLRVPALR